MRWMPLIITIFTFYTLLGFMYGAVAEMTGRGYEEDTPDMSDEQPWTEFHWGEYDRSEKYNFQNMKIPEYLAHGATVYIEGEVDLDFKIYDVTEKKIMYLLRIKFWNANIGQQEDAQDYEIPLTGYIDTPTIWGEEIDVIDFNITGGLMPKTDYYFVIELLEKARLADVNYINDIPTFIPKQDVVEKYGGMIQGEEEFHGKPIVRHGDTGVGNDWIDWFTKYYRNYGEGFEMVGAIPVVGNLINAVIFGLIPFILGYVVYSEFKSWTRGTY